MTLQLLFLIPLFAVAHGASVGLDMTSMIVGGRVAQPGEIPYQVSLQDIPTEHHFCGGVIISQLYILTAAHCVDGRDIRNISVNVGLVDLRDLHAIHLIESSYVHEDYDPSNVWINDIALLKLQSPLQYSRLVAPVELTANETVEAGSPAVVSGFGKIKMESPFRFEKRNYLLYVAHNRILDQTECKKIYSDVHDVQICANDPIREQGSCHGDSGGPLTVYGKLIGLVSWAYACADVFFPTVFTRVPSYIRWINQHTLSDEFERSNRNLF